MLHSEPASDLDLDLRGMTGGGDFIGDEVLAGECPVLDADRGGIIGGGELIRV